MPSHSELEYPSSRILSALSLNDPCAVAAPQGRRVFLKDNDHALIILVTLLKASTSFHSRGHELKLRLRWAVEMGFSAWCALAKRSIKPLLPISLDAASIMLGYLVETVIELQDSERNMTSEIPKLLECIRSLTARPKCLTNPNVVNNFILMWLTILRACKHSTRIFGKVRAALGNKLHLLSDTTSSFGSHGKQLHEALAVLVPFLTESKHMQLAKIPIDSLRGKNPAALLSQISRPVGPVSEETSETTTERPMKRLRRDDTLVNEGKLKEMAQFTKLDRIFGGWDDRVAERAQDLFAALDTTQKLDLVNVLGNVFCERALVHKPLENESVVCKICAASRITRDSASRFTWSVEFENSLIDVFVSILQVEGSKASPLLKARMMVTMSQIAWHTSLVQELDLNTGAMGKWCLQYLRSSSKELRHVAVNLFYSFTASGDCSTVETLRQNRKTALNYLRNIREIDERRLSETLITGLGHLGPASSEEEMNLIVVQLIDYLGDSHALVSGLAYVELQSLAERRDETVETMVRPFLGSIALAAVQDMRKKPQKLQHVADVLEWSINRFLHETQEWTVPHLALRGQVDTIDRICKAANNEHDAWTLCLQPKNLAALLALTLTQHPPKGEAITEQCLKRINPAISASEMDQIFRLDPAAVAREILILVGDGPETAQQKVRRTRIINP